MKNRITRISALFLSISLTGFFPVADAEPIGVKSVNIYNCTPDKILINVWTMDISSDSTWREMGTLEGQYQNGTCPGRSLPLVLPLLNGHVYSIVAVAPSRCGGINDPANGRCQVNTTTIRGDQSGPIYNINLAGNVWLSN